MVFCDFFVHIFTYTSFMSRHTSISARICTCQVSSLHLLRFVSFNIHAHICTYFLTYLHLQFNSLSAQHQPRRPSETQTHYTIHSPTHVDTLPPFPYQRPRPAQCSRPPPLPSLFPYQSSSGVSSVSECTAEPLNFDHDVTVGFAARRCRSR